VLNPDWHKPSTLIQRWPDLVSDKNLDSDNKECEKLAQITGLEAVFTI
jgi:hypothetical protein